MTTTIVGEFFDDNAGLHVCAGAAFYRCPFKLVPRFAREFDEVVAKVDDATNRVVAIEQWTRSPVQKWPNAPSKWLAGQRGRVTHYDGRSGTIDGKIVFARDVVKALGAGEVEVGEMVEYVLGADGAVTRVSGPYDTHVSHTGRLLPSRA